VLWHREAWPRLRQAPLESGARHVVHALVAEGRVREVPVDDPGVVHDIDTPEDYAAASLTE
jgi:molybdenum cofactor cytidylyltransferase